MTHIVPESNHLYGRRNEKSSISFHTYKNFVRIHLYFQVSNWRTPCYPVHCMTLLRKENGTTDDVILNERTSEEPEDLPLRTVRQQLQIIHGAMVFLKLK